MYIHIPTVRRTLASLVNSPVASLRRLATVGPFALGVHAPLTVALGALRAIDHVVFPGFQTVEIHEPVFVIANPRSGTTYLHRLLCLDEERFTFLRLWQTCMPAVSFYRAVELGVALDERFGGHLAKLVHRFERAAFGGWDGVHNMGFQSAEEEEAYFVHTWLTPAMMFFHPVAELADELGILDHYPDHVREAMMRFHRTSLQRHVFADGGERRFLSKNVMSCGRVQSILQTYPDARIVHIVRHPYDALPSFCSMFSMPWLAHSPQIPQDSDAVRAWARLGILYYRHVFGLGEELPPNQFVAVRYDDLVRDPFSTITTIYGRLGLEMTPTYRERLERETRKSRSYEARHAYALGDFGLDRGEIYAELSDLFETYGFDPDYDPGVEGSSPMRAPTSRHA